VQLNKLESHGLIAKLIYAEMLKVEYSLTELGCTMVPIVVALGEWGDEHQEHLRRVIEETSPTV
jgi:DNA-binding HxlR family transcriptional regulator